jgi:hypothetical protein
MLCFSDLPERKDLTMVQTLKLEDVGCDKKYYPRVGGEPDWFTVNKYREALITDPEMEFPPIVVVRSQGEPFPFTIIDGLHRRGAYARAGREKIPATVERIPKSKWLERSVELNSCNARPFDVRDKAWIATRMVEDGYTIEKVAELLKMRVETLEKIKHDRCVKISHKNLGKLPKGSTRQINGEHVGFLKAPLVESADLGHEMDALASQGSVSSRSVLNILDSMISVLRSGVVSMANEEMAAKVKEIKKLLREL